MDLLSDERLDDDDRYDDTEPDPTDVVNKRVGAFLVDLTICVLALVIPLLIFGATFSSPRLESRSPDISRANGDVAVFARDRAVVFAQDEVVITAIIAGLVTLLIFVVLPGFTGASPGKAVGDIRVVQRDGSRAGLARSLLRTVFWIIDGLPGLPLVGYVSARFTRRHQRVGDRVARTYVVDKEHFGHPIDESRPARTTTAETTESWMEGLEPATAPAGPAGVSVFGNADPAGLDRPAAEPSAPSAWAPAAGAAAATPAAPEPAAPEPAAPEPEPQPSPAPAAASTPAGGAEGGQFKADEPVWDQRRRTYIMYDSRRSAWLGWDDNANEWRRLGGGGAA